MMELAVCEEQPLTLKGSQIRYRGSKTELIWQGLFGTFCALVPPGNAAMFHATLWQSRQGKEFEVPGVTRDLGATGAGRETSGPGRGVDAGGPLLHKAWRVRRDSHVSA